MIILQKSFLPSCVRLPHPLPVRRRRRMNHGRQFKPVWAKSQEIRQSFRAKEQEQEEEEEEEKQPTFSLRISKVLLARGAISVLGLGFLDAGYSGDWSRVGVISKETEELLKLAAYAVIPLCLLLILSIPNEGKT